MDSVTDTVLALGKVLINWGGGMTQSKKTKQTMIQAHTNYTPGMDLSYFFLIFIYIVDRERERERDSTKRGRGRGQGRSRLSAE